METEKYKNMSEIDLLREKVSLERKLEWAQSRKESDEQVYEKMKSEDRVEAEDVWLQSINISKEKIVVHSQEIKKIDSILNELII